MVRKAAAITTAVLVLTLGVAGCTASPATRVPSQSSSPTSAPVMDQSDEQNATIKAFVSAAWQSRYDEATQYVSPGSVAERYVVHQKAVMTAYAANGEGSTDSEAQPTLTFTDGVVTVAEGTGATPYTLTDFTFDDGGLVTSWTGRSGAVAAALWTQPWSGQTGGNTVDLVSAYKANSGALLVVLKVAANEAATAPYGYSATYSASDGITYSATSASQPQTIAAGSAGYLVLIFDGAPFGGTVTVEGANPADYSISWTATVPVA